MKRIIRAWWQVTKMALIGQILTTGGWYLFIIGKIIRFILFFAFLYLVVQQRQSLAGYSPVKVIWFYLVFNLLDIATQTLFRGTYWFRRLLIQGDFDLDLIKPLPSFFRPVFGWPDILDFVTFIPLIIFMTLFALFHQLIPSFSALFSFLFLFINSLFLAFAFHLMVASICILSEQNIQLTWIYRDLTAMGRFPTDIYPRSIRLMLTFIVPTILLITFPAQAALGLLPFPSVFIATLATIIAVMGALKFWSWALRRYTSASS